MATERKTSRQIYDESVRIRRRVDDGRPRPKITSSENNSDRGEYRESRIPQKWSPSARRKHLQNLTPAIPPEFWKNDPRTSP
jgi:hypothetical protein